MNELEQEAFRSVVNEYCKPVCGHYNPNACGLDCEIFKAEYEHTLEEWTDEARSMTEA